MSLAVTILAITDAGRGVGAGFVQRELALEGVRSGTLGGIFAATEGQRGVGAALVQRELARDGARSGSGGGTGAKPGGAVRRPDSMNNCMLRSMRPRSLLEKRVGAVASTQSLASVPFSPTTKTGRVWGVAVECTGLRNVADVDRFVPGLALMTSPEKSVVR